MSLGHMAHVLRPHLLIGKLFGNKRVTSWFTHGSGSIRGGLEFSSGLFGLLPTTLLLTSVLASVLFFFFVINGLSGNICFRVSSVSSCGQ